MFVTETTELVKCAGHEAICIRRIERTEAAAQGTDDTYVDYSMSC